MSPQDAFNESQRLVARSRAEAMKNLRDSGKTLAEVGQIFGGISRQAVQALIARHFPDKGNCVLNKDKS